MAPRKPAKKKHETVTKMDTIKPKPDEKKEMPNGVAASASVNSNTDAVDNSIISFLRANTDSLAAIGLIGTMISLMPSFVEKLNDDVWLGTFSGFQIEFLFLSIIAGIIFIFLIFLSILDKYFQDKVELPFAILLIFFIIFLGSFILFIYSAIMKYIYVQWLLLVLYIILAYFLIRNRESETKSSKRFSFYVILFLAALILINMGVMAWTSFGISKPDANNTKIQADVNYYTPLIPNTYGIGFSPTSDKKISFNDYYVNWTTDFGYFFNIDSNTDRIKYLGDTTTNRGQTVYWTYNKEKISERKPTVNISMIIKNQANEILTSSVTQINWSDTDMAHVIT